MLIVKPSAVRIIAASRRVRLKLLAVDCRQEAEGSGAGREDCGPRGPSEALPYCRLANNRGQGTFLGCYEPDSRGRARCWAAVLVHHAAITATVALRICSQGTLYQRFFRDRLLQHE